MDSRTKWHRKLALGLAVIDNQHKIMFDLIKDLNNAIRVGAAVRVLDTLLMVFQNYAFQHFQTEEDCFKNHADSTRHCLEHYRLIKQLNAFIVDFRNNRRDGDRTPSDFLENWLLRHIEEFDRPILSGNDVRLNLMGGAEDVDSFEPELKERRRYKRIHYQDVVDGDIKVSCYNTRRLKVGDASIIDMSPAGLMLKSDDAHHVDDLLEISCHIGANFKMKEKVKVKAANGNHYGVQFVSPAPATVEFFTKLYGAIHMGHSRL